VSGSRFRHAHAQWSARRAITTLGPCIDAGHLPGFQRLHDEASVWVTQADEHPPFLEPWIQSITVHSGESYHEHGVFNLDEGPSLPSSSPTSTSFGGTCSSTPTLRSR